MTPDQVTLPDAVTGKVMKTDEVRVKVYSKHPVLVGQWFSTLKGVQQEWRYSQGASSSMSSVYMTPGQAYSRSKKYSKSTSATVTFPVAHGKVGKYYRTFFRYAKYDYYYCDGVACGWVGSRVKPYKWDRGAQVISDVPAPTFKRKNCSPYPKGVKDYSRGSKAIEWSNGVLVSGDLFKEIGSLSMSSQTGFTSDAENSVHFAGRRGLLCGWSGPLGDNPRILGAKPW